MHTARTLPVGHASRAPGLLFVFFPRNLELSRYEATKLAHAEAPDRGQAVEA